MKAIFIKRFWIAEILALGLAAFFMAGGVGQMLVTKVEAQLESQIAAPPSSGRPLPPTGPAPRRVAADGTPILSRNIFDSVTGPISRDGSGAADDGAGDVDPALLAAGDYIAVEPCAEQRNKVFTTVASTDPSASFALLGSAAEQKYYNVGDTVGTQRIRGIGWRYVLLESGRGSGVCYLDLYGLEDTLYLPVEGETPAPAAVSGPAEDRRAKSVLPASDVLEIGDRGAKVIDRAVFERPLGELAPLIGAVQVAAFSEDPGSGEVDGYSVHGIRRGSLLHEIGLRNGDLIRRVAGIEIRDGAAALAAYGLAAKSGQVTVELERAGKTKRITLDIR